MITTAITKTPLGSLPSGSKIEIAEQIDLGHYSSRGFYDLRLSDGSILEMVDITSELNFSN